ncbi:hypothetical protein Q3G72_008329 [Acer saccharum]|nr:hypothetical protein Q3G72_008329 [Acer saccharum]
MTLKDFWLAGFCFLPCFGLLVLVLGSLVFVPSLVFFLYFFWCLSGLGLLWLITNVVGEPSFADRGCKPKFGMEFDSEEIAYKFYNEYAGKIRFSIRKEVVVKNKRTGEVTSRIFVCSKEGFRSKNKRDSLTKHPRAETRTGCDARMSIKLNRCGNKFIVNHFEEVHNHALVTQDCTHMLPSQRKISSSQATELELAEESDISIKNSYELMGRQSGGRESLGYIKQDIKNYLRTKRQRQLAFGETGSLLKYF